MIRMGGADAFMLLNETPRAYMHTFKVAILDPSTDPEGWSFERFYRDFEERLHLVPMFRWKFAPTPLGLNHPIWVDDPDFNLAYHIRRVSCPAPGDHRALCDFMSSVYAYQLDRSRPLWLCWVVEGLEDGRIALVTLVHHAYVDGVGAAWSLQQLYRPNAGWKPPAAPPWQPEPWPGWGKRLLWGLRDWPDVMVKNLPRVLVGMFQRVKINRQYRKSGHPPPPSAAMMPQTPLNRTLSYGRTFVCDSLPLGTFKTVSKRLGVTINDVFTSCCAGAIRRLLRDLDYDPDQHPLICGTPFAGERKPGWEGMGNFAMADYCWLRSDLEDPLQRLRASHEALADMKVHLKATAEAGADLNGLFQVMPPWGVKLVRHYINGQQGRIGLFANAVLSNVPGPQEPIYLNRYKLDSWFSTGQIFDGSCLNMTMWSYCGRANLCILIDREILEDGWVMFDYFSRELALLADMNPSVDAAAHQRPDS